MILGINIKNSKLMKKVISWIFFAETIVLIPLSWIAIDYFLLRKNKKQLTIVPELEAYNLQQFCNEIDFSDSTSKLNQIFKLEQKQKAILNGDAHNLYTFPVICERALNQLRVVAAPELAKQGKTLEAIRNLCNIPNSSEFLTEAVVWLDHWYRSSTWGEETKLYLQEIPKCPSGKVLEPHSVSDIFLTTIK